MKRYQLVPITNLPNVRDLDYSDLDEAIVACGAFYDVIDRETGDCLTPGKRSDVDAAKTRLANTDKRTGS